MTYITFQPAANPVPEKVTRRQARQALVLAGKLSLVQPAIDAIADPIQRQLMQIDIGKLCRLCRSFSTAYDKHKRNIGNRSLLRLFGRSIKGF